MLSRLGTILKWIVLLPILALIALVCLANDAVVTVHLDPFDPTDSLLSYDVPLYQVGFALFVIGALVGALLAWSGQVRSRRDRQRRSMEAERREAEAARARETRAALLPPNRS